jgi:hypothetical protein
LEKKEKNGQLDLQEEPQIKFGNMNREQQEILNRVKLLMKYDTKNTLNENFQVISEQYAPTNEKLWQMVNGGDQDSILAYACGLKEMNFRQLVNLWKTMSPKSGVITPDLQGYGIYNSPTAASVILENEIYLRRKKNENDFAKILIPLKEILSTKRYGWQAKDTSNQVGKTAVMPESTLLSPGKVDPKKGGFVGNTIMFANRPATLICDEKRVLPKATPKEKKQVEKGMDFTNIPNRKTMFDKFKFYYEKKNPSQTFDTLDLRKDGENKDKYGVPPENSIKKFIEQNWQYPSDAGTNIYDIAISVGYNKTQSKQILEKFGTQNEKGEIYWKNRTEKEKKQEEIKKQEGEYDKQLSDKQGDLIKNKLVLRVFPNAAELVKDEDCKKQYLKFFQAIVDGSVKNKNNKIVGKAYYNSKGQMYYAKWNESTPPCSDEWWDEYGMYVQIGGMLAVSILTGGMGTIGTIIELIADAGLNLYSLKKNYKAQNEDAVKLDFAYLILPFAMASGPIKQILKNAKFGEETLKSVESKINNLGKYANSDDVKRVLDGMSEQEKRVIKELSKDEYKPILKKVGEEYITGLKGNAKPIRKISNPLIHLLVYGTPAAAYTLKKVSEIKNIYSKNNKPINVEEEAVWTSIFSKLGETKSNELINNLNENKESIEQITSNVNFINAVKKLQGISNEDEIKQIADDFETYMNNLVNQIRKEQNL